MQLPMRWPSFTKNESSSFRTCPFVAINSLPRRVARSVLMPTESSLSETFVINASPSRDAASSPRNPPPAFFVCDFLLVLVFVEEGNKGNSDLVSGKGGVGDERPPTLEINGTEVVGVSGVVGAWNRRSY